MTTKNELTCVPLTASRWGDLEKLFGEKGACGGCWCMNWRLNRRDWEAGKGEANREALRSIVESDETPGVIAYDEGRPIGWCSIAPREKFPALGRSRVLAAIDEKSVWSITCLFIAKDLRRRGVSVKLIEGAVAFAVERGATIVEAYPVVPYSDKIPDPFAWTGLLASYLKAGFEEVARRSKNRPIVRKECKHSP